MMARGIRERCEHVLPHDGDENIHGFLLDEVKQWPARTPADGQGIRRPGRKVCWILF
jgi:hypothetical protein